jgi:hypothetical protein
MDRLMQGHVYCNTPCGISGSVNVADFFDQTIDPQVLQNNLPILLIIESLKSNYVYHTARLFYVCPLKKLKHVVNLRQGSES